jgi:hypothetical protein
MTDFSIWSDIDYDCDDNHCDNEYVCKEPCIGRGATDNIYHEETCNKYHNGIRAGMFEVVRKLLQDNVISLKVALSCINFNTEEQAELTDLYFKGVYDYGGNCKRKNDCCNSNNNNNSDFHFKEGYEYGIIDALFTLYDKNIINDEQARQYSS